MSNPILHCNQHGVQISFHIKHLTSDYEIVDGRLWLLDAEDAYFVGNLVDKTRYYARDFFIMGAGSEMLLGEPFHDLMPHTLGEFDVSFMYENGNILRVKFLDGKQVKNEKVNW